MSFSAAKINYHTNNNNRIPLALYVHIPWCIRKCPYCDFNSHALRHNLPETEYVQALINDLKSELNSVNNREIQSIFFGGGTPSLFSPLAIETLLNEFSKQLTFAKNIEITLEANPGTVEQSRFIGLKKAGINRLSLGIQSFQADKLRVLGRIHGREEAIKAVAAAHAAGFDNFNLDLMFGLPQQTLADAIADLTTAVSLSPTHISWYQLTLEPNTLFYAKPPSLPMDESIWEIQTAGQAYLSAQGFQQYEISAYSKNDSQCKHNLNYWMFGDYLGIGAGAHGKITDINTSNIIRKWKTKHPKDYLDPSKPYLAGTKLLTTNELPLEFMLNAMRLNQPISTTLFSARTGLQLTTITAILDEAQTKGLLTWNSKEIILTALGRRYLNDTLELFLPE